jgi:hypothetical protein
MVSIIQGRAWPEDPLFPLGKTVATRGVLAGVLPEAVYKALARHERGDWGEVPTGDKVLNDRALEAGGRLVSQWRDPQGTKFYIITEADRSITTVLLPDEY